MNRRDVAFLACRIMAMAAWFFAVTRLERVVDMVTYALSSYASSLPLRSMTPLYMLLTALAAPGFATVAGVLVWTKSDALADRMLPAGGDADGRVTVHMDRDAALSIAAAVMGLLLVVWGVLSLTVGVTQWIYVASLPGFEQFEVQMKVSANRFLICGGVQMILGLVMLLGSRAAVGLVNRVREFGRTKVRE